MPQAFTPAKGRVVFGIAALASVVILGFTALLSANLQLAHNITPLDFTQTSLQGFVFEVSSRMEGKKIVVEGWACETELSLDTVENDIVLYSVTEDAYLQIPTQMQQTDAPNLAVESEEDYSHAGFYAAVWQAQLSQPYSDYEICMAFRNNSADALVHTGVMLEVAP